MLPEQTSQGWLSEFCDGLRADQDDHNVHLSGGDTTSTNGPLSVAITMIGTVPAGKAVKRSTARIGDDIWVTGTIGDAAMGLQALKGALPTIDAAARHALVRRYHVPQPPELPPPCGTSRPRPSISLTGWPPILAIFALHRSRAKVPASKIPVSDHVLSLLNTSAITFETILSGGDDYELISPQIRINIKKSMFIIS